MPFSWNQTEASKPSHAKQDKALQMYEAEVYQRAALLMRLGYSLKEATSRLQSNASWDFEINAMPKFSSRLKKIVEKVYKQKGAVGGGAPTLE